MTRFLSILLSVTIAFTCAANAEAQEVLFDTTYAAGNGQAGNMFDVKASEDLIITRVDAHINAGTWDVEIYYTPGGYTGNQSSLQNWTFAGKVSVTGLGNVSSGGLKTPIPLQLDVPISAGQTMGFYVTLSNGTSINYTNGSTEGNLFATDGILSFYEGIGLAYPAGGSFSPRIWNGTIYYTLGGTADQEGYLELYPVSGNSKDSRMGAGYSACHDVNRDGITDYALGSPGEFSGDGQVFIHSGVDGQLLVKIKGLEPGGNLGAAVANAGDVNASGNSDLLVGAPGTLTTQPGQVFVHYDGSNIAGDSFTGLAGDHFGSALAGLGDIDGDSKSDILIGAPAAKSGGPDSGRFYVYAGEVGTVLLLSTSSTSGDRLGAAVTSLGDVDFDGVPDFAVGAPGASQVAGDNRGRVEVWSGATLTKLYDVFGFANDSEFGFALTDVGDITGDGRSDFAVGAPAESVNIGAAYVLSGATGSLIYKVEGLHADARFGTSLAMLGDTNGDGLADLGIGAPAKTGVWGYTSIVIAETGATLTKLVHGGVSTSFGAGQIALGDVNGDTLDDFLVTAPDEYSNGNSGAGVARIVTTLGAPTVAEVLGVHVLDTGEYVIKGSNLIGATAYVDGVLVPFKPISPAEMRISVSPVMPGGFHDLRLENALGSLEVPKSLPRYPALYSEPTVELGETIDIELANGEEGAYFLAFSGATYASPAPFPNWGWYYGLELNGTWMMESGLFTPGETSRTITMTAPSASNLVGFPFYFQALTTQLVHGEVGFTGTTSITIVTPLP